MNSIANPTTDLDPFIGDEPFVGMGVDPLTDVELITGDIEDKFREMIHG
jgi:hypothetical protein